MACGITTCQKIRRSGNPSVLAASISVTSTCSNAPLAARYISGNEMTTAAMTVAAQENTILTPNSSKKSCPSGRFTPKSISRKKPATVGGSTMGRVKIPSSTILSFLERTATTALAVHTPRKNVTAMDSDAVFIEIRIGDQSIGYRFAEKPYFAKASAASPVPR